MNGDRRGRILEGMEASLHRPARCPDCGLLLLGAQVCPACGAFDFGGPTGWVCFPCGAQNPHGIAACTCGRPRTVECGSCGEDAPFRSERCPGCGVPRFAFDAAREARGQAERLGHSREAARWLALRSLVLVGAGAALLLLSSRASAHLAGWTLLATGAGGEVYALVLSRSVRRELQ